MSTKIKKEISGFNNIVFYKEYKKILIDFYEKYKNNLDDETDIIYPTLINGLKTELFNISKINALNAIKFLNYKIKFDYQFDIFIIKENGEITINCDEMDQFIVNYKNEVHALVNTPITTNNSTNNNSKVNNQVNNTMANQLQQSNINQIQFETSDTNSMIIFQHKNYFILSSKKC